MVRKRNIAIEGEGSCYYYWSAFGIRRDSFIEQYDRQLVVRRRYLNQEGIPYNNEFRHGNLVIAEITVKALTSDLENVVVVDMLPAGFEIENARLASAGGHSVVENAGLQTGLHRYSRRPAYLFRHLLASTGTQILLRTSCCDARGVYLASCLRRSDV